MLVVLAGAVEPAVVGDVDEEIDLGAVPFGRRLAAGEEGIGVLVADHHAEGETVRAGNASALPGRTL